MKGIRKWFYWQSSTVSDEISKPNPDADVSIGGCPRKRFGYVDMLMDVILTIVFHDEQNELCKVFSFDLLNQI